MATSQLNIRKVTIAEGASMSDAVNAFDDSIIGLFTYGDWDTAVITFQVSYHGGTTYLPVYDSNGSELEIEFDNDQYVSLNPTLLPGVQHVKLQSGTTAIPVNQTAAVDIYIVTKRV